ncbi:Uncharacterized protein dnm_091560 [Desulfonema magnum]|uniref:Uncharacterized protein n=1 Tax=Desulfonema magnum TaxID=45655 RepID=A0A975BWI7_9BACT|nr:Uncharacterized protein dnm_091560 [Desulfonema magnum]
MWAIVALSIFAYAGIFPALRINVTKNKKAVLLKKNIFIPPRGE